MTSAKTYKPLLGAIDKDVVVLSGYVDVDSDGYTDSSASTLQGVTFEHTGTGEYTFTIEDPKGSVLFAQFTPVAATAVDLVSQVVSFDADEIVVRTLAGATPTTPSAAFGFLVTIHYKRSTTRAAG